MKTFKVSREDDCIWIEDLRRTADPEFKDDSVTHTVPEQAEELIHKLQSVIHTG